jgi:hypothetical protein
MEHWGDEPPMTLPPCRRVMRFRRLPARGSPERWATGGRAEVKLGPFAVHKGASAKKLSSETSDPSRSVRNLG